MKENELREVAICGICKKPFGHTGIPLFYRVTIDLHSVNMDTVKRQDGLTALLGGHAALAGVMGPNENMTTVEDSTKLTVCHTCAFVKFERVAYMFEECK